MPRNGAATPSSVLRAPSPPLGEKAGLRGNDSNGIGLSAWPCEYQSLEFEISKLRRNVNAQICYNFVTFIAGVNRINC